MRVTEIWRFPIRSVGGESVPAVEVGRLGLAGDRGWGIADIESGTVLTARRVPELLFASSRIDDDGAVVMTLPDGTEVGGGDDAEPSAWLGRGVELRAAGDDGGIYENPLDAENDAEWVSWQGPAGAWHDSTRERVSLVSLSSLGRWDVRRFRSNIVVDGADEDAFVGAELAVGGVELDVRKRIDRCVMVTRPQPGLGRDLDVLRTINAERDRCLAIGALVRSGGRMCVGDEVVAM